MALSKATQKTAQALLEIRPTVLPGTRVILDDAERKRWNAAVTAAMRAENVADKDVATFCDQAGVAN